MTGNAKLLKALNSLPDLSFYQETSTEEGTYWCYEYRCIKSDEDYDLYFPSLEEAVVHFISDTLKSIDKLMSDEEE